METLSFQPALALSGVRSGTTISSDQVQKRLIIKFQNTAWVNVKPKAILFSQRLIIWCEANRNNAEFINPLSLYKETTGNSRIAISFQLVIQRNRKLIKLRIGRILQLKLSNQRNCQLAQFNTHCFRQRPVHDLFPVTEHSVNEL